MRLALVKMAAVSVFGLLLPRSVAQQTRKQEAQVLFVCEHGNVKSLMAASYFNQLAQELGLSYRAVPRGTAPNSTTVPPVIIAGLRNDGIDVGSFHPSKLRVSDITQSTRVITIGVELPTDANGVVGTKLGEWSDGPAATVDFSEASRNLKAHVERLVEELTLENVDGHPVLRIMQPADQ